MRKDRDQGILPSGYQFLGPAPSLPERYVKDVSRSRPNLAQSPSGDDHEYLEPLSGPEVNTYNKLAGGGNIKAENQYELARPPDSTSPTGVPAPPGVKPRGDGTYFARIDVAKDGADEDGGYSTLGRKVADGEGGGGGQADPAETEPLTTAPLSGGGERTGGDEPKYYVLEPENPTEHDAHTTTTTQLWDLLSRHTDIWIKDDKDNQEEERNTSMICWNYRLQSPVCIRVILFVGVIVHDSHVWKYSVFMAIRPDSTVMVDRA